MNRRYMVLGAAALAVVALGAFETYRLVRPNDIFAQCRNLAGTGGNMVAGGDIGGPFTLVDTNGKTVTDKELITKPTLLYFGYTFCPDVCPLDNARNADAVSLLDARGYRVRPVFISIDPGRDTPEVVAQFTDYLHPRMLGLTGSPEQVRAASRAYRTFFRIQDPDEEYYLIDHSTFTYLAFPETGVVEVFGRDVTPEDMADRVACFIDSL